MDMRDLTDEERTVLAEFRLCDAEDRSKILSMLHTAAEAESMPNTNTHTNAKECAAF